MELQLGSVLKENDSNTSDKPGPVVYSKSKIN